jgi:hypothetical protein
MRILILGLLGLLLLAPPAFPQTSASSASYGGCLVRADLTVLEIIPGACAPKIVKALAESLDLVCTPALQEEAASLSVAAATNQGLSAKAMARLKVLEAVCPSGPPAPPQPPLFLLGAIPLWLRRRLEAGNLNDRKGQGDVGLLQQVPDIQKRSYPLFDMKQWLGTTDRITCKTLQQFTYAVQTRDNLPQVRNVTCNVREGGTNKVYFWSREADTVRVADCSKYWTHSMCHPSSDDVRHYSSDEWVELTRK